MTMINPPRKFELFSVKSTGQHFVGIVEFLNTNLTSIILQRLLDDLTIFYTTNHTLSGRRKKTDNFITCSIYMNNMCNRLTKCLFIINSLLVIIGLYEHKTTNIRNVSLKYKLNFYFLFFKCQATYLTINCYDIVDIH